MSHWTASDIPDQTGRTFVITGANSGIGLAAARELGRHGAHVVLAVRDVDKGRVAAETIGGHAELKHLDLADLDSVRAFAAAQGPADVLINNAGVMNVAEQRTKDGFELQMATNHLGHFALTNLLLPRLADRVVTVASIMHRRGTIDLDDLNWERTRYRRHQAYNRSKLANLLFSAELQRKLTRAGSSVRAVAAHPGYTTSNLARHAPSRLEIAVMVAGNRLFAQSSEMGALPTLFAATQDVPGDAYIGPGGPGEVRGYPAPASRSAAARDEETARRLWALSERLTGTHFPL
jgi:NAD(P)-dependent dehydrogenase (short-subunit alcohol dehydrogenase family)